MSARSYAGKGPAIYRSPHGLLASLADDGDGFSRTFAQASSRFLIEVRPQVAREMARTEQRARTIPSPRLRAVALRALAKRGNIEGAALFAVLAPHAKRRAATSALVAFQTAYNYLDSLSELPCPEPARNAERLHQALLCPLDASAAPRDYYACNVDSEDGGYLLEILAACREALEELPSSPAVAATAGTATTRIISFQTLNLAETAGGHDSLRRWARELAAKTGGLRWWEAAAGAGSSLAVHALIAASSNPDLGHADAHAIDAAYFPAMSALHSLLDSLVDRREDEHGGRLCLLDYYGSEAESATRLGRLASDARSALAGLPNGDAHRVILTAMCSYYLSAPQCRTREAHAIRASLVEALGAPLGLASRMFAIKRSLHRLKRLDYA